MVRHDAWAFWCLLCFLLRMPSPNCFVVVLRRDVRWEYDARSDAHLCQADRYILPYDVAYTSCDLAHVGLKIFALFLLRLNLGINVLLLRKLVIR